MRKKLPRKQVFVALSGGVDSSVAALLLKRRGYNVVGVFMRCWHPNSTPLASGLRQSEIAHPNDCPVERDAEDARRVAEHLGIPFYVWDFEKEYKRRVVDYMIEGYARGETPNPDVMCNREIKFGLFLQKALAMGAEYVATGHYVRLIRAENPSQSEALVENSRRSELISKSNERIARRWYRSSMDYPQSRGLSRGKTPQIQMPILTPDRPWHTAYSLYQARDENKDQSYFLWTLTQNQLRHCLFPIGDYLKSEVREIARCAGLPTAEKKDSQGICFLGKVTLADFLRQYIPEQRGVVLTTAGEKLGEHHGAWYYTVGQRHGLDLKEKRRGKSEEGDVRPHYVARKDAQTNTIVVAEGDDNPALYKREAVLRDVNFIQSVCEGPIRTNGGIRVEARVRYHQPLAPAVLIAPRIKGRGSRNSKTESVVPSPCSMTLRFDSPQKFVAPGQSAVFYSRNPSVNSELELLGGGVIV